MSVKYIIVYTNRRRGLAVVQAGESDRIDYDIASSYDFECTPEGEADADLHAARLAEKHHLHFTPSGPNYLD